MSRDVYKNCRFENFENLQENVIKISEMLGITVFKGKFQQLLSRNKTNNKQTLHLSHLLRKQ